MATIQFRQNLFHNGLPIKGGFCVYTKPVAIFIDCSQFLIIEIYDLPVLSQQRFLLFLQILRIHSRGLFLFGFHFLEKVLCPSLKTVKYISVKYSNLFGAKTEKFKKSSYICPPI